MLRAASELTHLTVAVAEDGERISLHMELQSFARALHALITIGSGEFMRLV